jgi:hypothetical protein
VVYVAVGFLVLFADCDRLRSANISQRSSVAGLVANIGQLQTPF